MSRIDKSIKAGSRLGVARGQILICENNRREWVVNANGYKVSFGGNILKFVSDDGCTILCMQWKPLNCTLHIDIYYGMQTIFQ